MKRVLIAAVLLAISGFGCQWCSETLAPKANATKFSVNPLFTNEMVLQREMRVPVWGKGVPGEVVAVEIDKKKYTATVDKKGKWMLYTRTLPVGGPYVMKISGAKKVITLKDIMSGDVWICSGQSNMAWTVIRSNNAKKEIVAANYPNIRLFQVARTVSAKPLDTVKGKWTKCTPATVKYFSAVGYFFGRDLYKSLKTVPIGLIHTSWGGTPAEAWTRHDYLDADPMLKQIFIRHEKRLDAFPKSLEKYKKEIAAYKKKIAELKKSKTKPKKRLRRPRYPYHDKHPHRPAGLYNAMINPLLPYGIKGAIWYQGESNAGRAYQYRTLLPAMINSWRKSWDQGDFPFLIVELANYSRVYDHPVKSTWAELREAQNMTAANLPACGVASAIDIGEARDIHPKNKQDVGKRLQLAALKIAYDKDIIFSGPTYKSSKIEANKIIITFDNIGGGLRAHNGNLQRFAIAGKDKKFVWGKADIKGSTVIVSSSKVKNPLAVRYAWSNNPEGCNLYNKEGLPAIPFRTDTWNGVTFKNR
jgi:sialate O-acetylesterase